MRRYFTESEFECIRSVYPSGGYRAVQTLIGGGRDAISAAARRMGIRRNKGWNDNKTDMSWLMMPKTPEAAYVLGMIWADGHLHRRRGKYKVTLSLCGDDFSDIHKMFDEWSFSVLNVAGPYQVQFVAVLCHKMFCLFLESNDYLLKSSVSPDKILTQIPSSLHRYFYRGWFDGDGSNSCLDRDFGHVCLAGTIDQDWQALINLANQLEISYDIRKQSNHKGGGSVFAFNGRRASLRFMSYVYAGKTFGFSRKLKSWHEYVERFRSELKERQKVPIGVYRTVAQIERYIACASSAGKTYRLGCYDTKVDASKVRDDKMFKMFQDETRLNDPVRLFPDFLTTFGVPKHLLNE